MKIIYFNTNEPLDQDIIKALKKLNHKVILVEDFHFKETADLFLFRNTILPTNNLPDFYNGLIELQKTLTGLKCKKVFWFTDKIIGLGNDLLEIIIPLVDVTFLNDDTWVRRHDYKNVYPLHLAAGSVSEGHYDKKYDADIAFNGNVYPPMAVWIDELKKVYGNRLKLFNVDGDEFANLCVSAKIIITSKFLLSDFYWTSTIYRTIAAGGFMVHPRLYGLDLKDKEHFIGYNSFSEMVNIINWFLIHDSERDGVVTKGRTEVLKNCTYENRLKVLLSK